MKNSVTLKSRSGVARRANSCTICTHNAEIHSPGAIFVPMSIVAYTVSSEKLHYILRNVGITVDKVHSNKIGIGKVR